MQDPKPMAIGLISAAESLKAFILGGRLTDGRSLAAPADYHEPQGLKRRRPTRAAAGKCSLVRWRASNSRRAHVVGLIHAQATPAGERDMNEPAPPLLVDRRAGHLLLSHPGHEFVDVATHQIELVLAVRIGRVKRDLCWRETEDEPAAPDVGVGEVEHITKERAVCVRIDAVDDRVCTYDHAGISWGRGRCEPAA